MTFKHAILAASVLAATGLGLAHAQTATPATAPNAPKGQLSTPNQDKGSTPRASVETRAEVKADAAAARASGSIVSGQQSTVSQGEKPKMAKSSENTRADVKADAAAARKSGTTVKGQESIKDQNKGGLAAKP